MADTRAAAPAPAPEPAPRAQPSPTPASSSPPTDGRSRHERIGQQALGRLRHVDISGLGWRVEFHPGREGYLGLADWRRQVVDIWVRDTHSVEEVIGTLAHEFAHVLDYSVWDDDIRNEWLRRRDLDIEWWPSCTCDDRADGAGDIAEALAALEAGPEQWTGHHSHPTDAQLAWLRSIL